MNVSYTGMQKALAPKLQNKLDAKFAKLSKLLERKGPKEAHVVVRSERHLHKVEITMQFYGHPLVGDGADADLFTALWNALEILEAQAVKQRAKWREKLRRPEAAPEAPVVRVKNGKPLKVIATKKGAGKGAKIKDELVGVVSGSDGKYSENGVRVFRVNHRDEHKPMTLDEAVLEMDQGRDYMVYQDTGREGVSILVRRRDGHFDLIES
jgi:ribosomal subunit interface protein